MGTLYDCLREARLEKYYPVFRANGITRSEALANLTMPEFCAMGISGSEDRRRLVELVNIIKSVHRGQMGNGGAVPRKRQPESPTPTSARSVSAASTATAYSSSQSEKKVPRRRPRSPAEGAVGGSSSTHSSSGMRLEPTRDVSVRERGPNFSAASYMDMLELMSESSQSDGGDQHSLSEESDTGAQPPRILAAPPPIFSNKVPRKTAPAERVKVQAKSKGYNYGVPTNRDSVKARVRPPPSSRLVKDDKIRVCVRKRPLSRRESRAADPDIIDAESTTTVVVKEPKVAVDLTAFTMKHEYVFDEVFDETCSNEDVYIRAARPLISTVFQGGNATFFAYGQTGAGKTHTMIGGSSVAGLYQLAAQDVFDIMASGQHGTDLHVWVSFFEIYCGQLFDLLNRRNRLVVREDGSHRVCIAGLTETEVPDVTALIRVLQYGNSVRSRGTSGVNPDSSRSHAVLQLEIRRADETKLGKISFIDLAGSERASDMGDPDRQTRMEGAEINQSLLALKECIRSIDQESRHTPFRQSKLTHILKDAFVGNSRTCMIANVSPVQSACEHTLNTLRYADRVKELRRESNQGGTGASFGQAMNLLMNIPITAPSIFHPSNVLSTSTPVRPHPSRTQQDPPPSAAADIMLDPSETPIRGHNVFPKSAPKLRSRPETAVTQSSSRQRSREAWQPRSSRSPVGATASHGFLPPHPEASPSESDHTDTDSNNVTHPTETRPAPSQPNIPVIGSTDTEFDFPTSDFNNVDEHDHLNDLNQGKNNLSHGGEKTKKPSESGLKEQSKGQGGQGQDMGDQAAAASASDSRQDWQRSQKAAPESSAMNQLSSRGGRRSPFFTSQAQRASNTSPSPTPKQSKNTRNIAEKGPAPVASSSSSTSGSDRGAAQPKTAISELGSASSSKPRKAPSGGPLSDSFDDELLFGEPGDAEAPDPQSEGFCPGGPTSSRVNKHLMNVMPAVQTALSSDLTSFSQRSPLRNGVEKTLANHSPRDQPEALPPPHNFTGSPRYTEGTDNARKDGSSTGRNRLPSPSSAAIKDWVSQRGDTEPVSARAGVKRYDSKPDKGGSGSSQTTNLPFSAYTVADTSPQNQLSARDRHTPKSNTHSSGKPLELDSPTLVKLYAPHAPSGPKSDPVVPSLASQPGQGAKDTHQSPSSLPTNPSPVNNQQDTAADIYNRNTPSSENAAPPVSVFASAKSSSSSSSAFVTEKLMSGAVFSPIHPQPVSTSGMRVVSGGIVSGSSSTIVHPTPVAGAPSVLTSGTIMSSSAFSVTEREQARVSLVASHEDQLAAITSLCKQEMKLLLNAKKVVPRSFDDYMNRVSGILAQKMSAIQLLHDQIQDYQAKFSPRHSNPAASVAASAIGISDSDSGSVTHT